MRPATARSRMGRWWIAATIGLLVTLCSPLVAMQTAGAQESGSAGRTLIVTLPRTTWETIDELRPPHLMEFFEDSAVALMSPRTLGPTTSPGEAYLSIGAGNRTAAVVRDGVVLDRTESVEEGAADALFLQRTGVQPDGVALALSQPAIERRNDGFLYGAEPGSLGEALKDDGRSMAVIGNADRSLTDPDHRHAGLAGIDRDGILYGGSVYSGLLRLEPSAPFGVEYDPEVLRTIYERTWAEHDVVLVEMSELERAEAFRGEATERRGDDLFEQALLASDEHFSMLMSTVGPQDTVMVVTTTPPGRANEMGVFAMAGPGVTPGWATSSTTRRDGYVTLTDIAPSILDSFDIEIPDAMNDTRLSSSDAGWTFDEHLDEMLRQAQRALVRDAAFGPISVIFIVVLVIELGLAMLCLARFPKLAGVVRVLGLTVLATLPVTYLEGLLPTEHFNTPILIAIVFGSALLVALAGNATRSWWYVAPSVVIVAALWCVLAVDILTGATLQLNTIFGYSPIVAGRFAGFGNQAFTMISFAAILVSSAYVDRRADVDGPTAGRATLAAVAALFLATVVLDGHPSLGSDVGGVLAFVPPAAVALALYSGRRIRVRFVLLVSAATLALLGVFAAIDLSRAEEDRTHLGRFVERIADGGAAEIIERKIAANLGLLTAIWTWVIPVALVYFAYLTWRPNRTLGQIREEYPHSRTLAISGLTLGVLAMAVNDSGVSMPAMMLAMAISHVTFLAMEIEFPPGTAARESATREPATSVSDVGGSAPS